MLSYPSRNRTTIRDTKLLAAAEHAITAPQQKTLSSLVCSRASHSKPRLIWQKGTSQRGIAAATCSWAILQPRHPCKESCPAMNSLVLWGWHPLWYSWQRQILRFLCREIGRSTSIAHESQSQARGPVAWGLTPSIQARILLLTVQNSFLLRASSIWIPVLS